MKKNTISYAKYGYIFSIPFVVAFLIFQLYPIIYTALIGFTDLKGLGNTTMHFLKEPFKNFQLILSNPSFKIALKNTFVIWITNFIPQMLVALILSAWFTSSTRIRGQGFFKVVFYMPNIITAATVAILFGALFSYPKGPANDFLILLGHNKIDFAQSKLSAQLVVAFIQFWMWYGYTMIILTSGILGINPEVFEAAEIDGTNGFQKFMLITLPNLKTIMLFTLVTSLIGGLQMFDIPKLYLLGGPDNATLTTSVFIYNQAFSGSYLYNRAAAASMIMFLIIAVLSSILFFLLRDKDEAAMAKAERKRIRAYNRQLKAQRANGGTK
jgi:multiple sugar transport system permease protein